jgi:Astacin (Peptidase family M12A)
MKIRFWLFLFFGILSAATAQLPIDTTLYEIVEGDMIMPIERGQAKTFTENCNFWENGRVPYEFDANVSDSNRSVMRQAMNRIEAISSVRFVIRQSESDYAHIQDSDRNNSFVGRRGGRQIINIISWGNQMIICHELFHCLGLRHEQSRPDRDNYVTILLNNVCPEDMRHNFDAARNAGHYGPYDFNSIMHYGRNDFGCPNPNGGRLQTIGMRPGFEANEDSIGNRRNFSRLDKLRIDFLYSRSDYCFFDVNNAFVNPCRNRWALGGFGNPQRDLTPAIVQSQIPSGSRVWIQPGTYRNAEGIYRRAMRFSAPLGGVFLK